MAVPPLVAPVLPREVVASVLELPGATVVPGTTPVVAVLNPTLVVPIPSVEVVASVLETSEVLLTSGNTMVVSPGSSVLVVPMPVVAPVFKLPGARVVPVTPSTVV